MDSERELKDPWLIAAWPGMGNVAVGAAAYLIEQLGAKLVHELPGRDIFDVQQIEVKEGLVSPSRLPRSMFFEWRDPQERRDLVVFIGEAQPSEKRYEFCHRILDYAQKQRISRLFTFAAMATQLHPSAPPSVYGVSTDAQDLAELREYEVQILEDGQISGLNGVLLAVAAERGLRGACLLAELPFFAVGVANPRASLAALQVFTSMAGIDIDFSDLIRQGEITEKGLLQLFEKMKEAARQESEGEEEEGMFGESTFEVEEPEEPTGESTIDPATRRRIERMFAEAERDRGKAVGLKAELDRLGIFEQFEDRFLDLFKSAE